MLLFGMEIPLWFSLVLIILIVGYWYSTQTFDVFRKMGVPFVKPIPIFGNIIEMVITGTTSEWDLNQLKAFPGKTHGCFQGRVPVLETSDVNLMKQLVIQEFGRFHNRHNIFQGEPNSFLKYALSITEDGHWKHVRELVTPTFAIRRVQAMYGVVEGCADRLVHHVTNNSSKSIDIKDFTSAYTMDVIASTAFGLNLDTQTKTNHPFVSHAGTIFGIQRDKSIWGKVKGFIGILVLLLLPYKLQTWFRRITGFLFFDEESLSWFEGVVDRVIADTKSQKQVADNFVSRCVGNLVEVKSVPKESIRISKAGGGAIWTTAGLTRNDIMANAIVFLAAGFETTATTLMFFFYSMANNPEVQQKLFEELDAHNDEDMEYDQLHRLEYLEWCINETLRLYPPVMRYDRVASEDCTVNGLSIPKGLVMNFIIYAIHHDPDYWPEPEKFRPERFSPAERTDQMQYTWIPFGLGNRNCVGQNLAKLEVKMACYKMMKAFRFERDPQTSGPADLKYKSGIGLLQPRELLKLRVFPRN